MSADDATTRPQDRQDALLAAYTEVSKAHAGLMDFRGKLLALLPIASGAGIFFLLNKDTRDAEVHYLLAVSIFGFVVMLGLYLHELYSIRWCDALFNCGIEIENILFGEQSRKLGPFRTAPFEFLGYVSARGAALLIYPAMLSAWSYLGLAKTSLGQPGCLWAWVIPLTVMIAFSLGGWIAIHQANPQEPKGVHS